MSNTITKIIETDFKTIGEVVAFNQKANNNVELHNSVICKQNLLPNGKYQFTIEGLPHEVERYIELLLR